MKILHLFPDLMNLYGEYGNVCAMKRTLEQKGEEVTVDTLTVGDDLSVVGEYDFIYIGSGTERNQKVAIRCMMEYKDDILSAAKNGRVMLATGNSFEIFGSEVKDCDGTRYDCLDYLSFNSTESRERIVTDAECTCDFLDKPLIGFVNKASMTYGARQPLFTMKTGCGNNKDETTEGIHADNVYGTHLIGPVLIRNPHFCEYLAELVIKNRI